MVYCKIGYFCQEKTHCLSTSYGYVLCQCICNLPFILLSTKSTVLHYLQKHICESCVSCIGTEYSIYLCRGERRERREEQNKEKKVRREKNKRKRGEEMGVDSYCRQIPYQPPYTFFSNILSIGTMLITRETHLSLGQPTQSLRGALKTNHVSGGRPHAISELHILTGSQ